MVPVVLQIV